jgi:hypothetical protein
VCVCVNGRGGGENYSGFRRDLIRTHLGVGIIFRAVVSSYIYFIAFFMFILKPILGLGVCTVAVVNAISLFDTVGLLCNCEQSLSY